MSDADSPTESPSTTAEVTHAARSSGRARGGRGLLLGLFWVLVLAGVGFAAWYYLVPQVQRYQDELTGLRADLLSVASQVAENEERQAELGQNLTNQQQSLSAVQSALEATQNELAALAARLRTVENARTGDWVVAEAQYLVRLASQKLLIGRDTASALRLLADADNLLFELGYPEARQAREALAGDMVRLRQVAAVDYQGVHFRLSGLIGLVNDLPPPAIPQLTNAAPAGDAPAASGWRHWLRLIAQRLEPFFIVRRGSERRDLIASEEVELQKLRVQILLNEAQLGLMATEQEIYRDSLERAAAILGDFFAQSAGSAALQEQLRELASREVRADIPEITASERALQDLLETLRASANARN